MLRLCVTTQSWRTTADIGGGDVNEAENEAENLKTFYCPSRQPKCSYKRDQRCTTAEVCLNPAGKEEGCEEATSPGRYEIFRGKSYIASFAKSSRDRKKRSVEDIKHWYLQYRGFVYEFGKPYGVQELDINDPNYKYGPGGTKKATWTMEGTSSCARGPVITVARCFEKLYMTTICFATIARTFIKHSSIY